MRIPARGGDKERGEGMEGTGKREREVKETKGKETGIDSLPRYEARREQHAPSNRVDSFQNWRGRGCTNVVVAA